MIPDYTVRRSRRRTMALEVTREGTALVRAPLRASDTDIARFVDTHRDWLATHMARRQAYLAAHPAPAPQQLEAWRQQAKAVLPERVAYWSTVMGVRPAGIKITTAKKRYGSCSSKHSLCFSCYLMRSPMEAVDLVVVHELCHIQEMNHGPRFYALLERYLPDWRERKRLLV